MYLAVAMIALLLLFWRPIAGLVLIAAIFPMDSALSPRLPVPGINTETVLLGVAFAVTLLRFGPRLPPLRYSGPVLAFILMMGVAFALAIPWARNVRMAESESAIWVVFKGWKSVTFSALAFFSTYWWFSQERDRQRLLEALSVGMLISAVAGFGDLALKINQAGVDGRAGGLQVDPNVLACALGSMMFVPLYLALYARDLSLVRRAFHAVSYALAFVALVLTLSRGNYLAIVLAHMVFFALVNRTLLFATVVAVALLSTVAFPLLPTNVRERIELTVSSGSGYRVAGAERLESSTAYRLVLARVGSDMFVESPLWGHGLNFFYFHVPEYGAKYGTLEVKDTHNLVLKVAVEQGAIGLAALGWLVFAVLRCGRRLWRADTSEHYVGAVLLACGTHLLIANLSTTAFLSSKDISLDFWILFALSARAYVERVSVAEAPSPAPVALARWRRFSHRIPAAASQQ
jgi:O-antigen ligase